MNDTPPVAETEKTAPPPRKRRFPWVIIPLLMMVSCGGLNYAGVCIPEMKYYTDKEILYRSIPPYNDRYGVDLYEKASAEDKAKVPYRTKEEFLALYPGCCAFPAVKPGDGGRPGFWDRVLFGYRNTIEKRFEAPVLFLDQRNNTVSQSVINTNYANWVDNCIAHQKH